MPRYTCDPNLELKGSVAIAMLNHINNDHTLPILIRHGLGQIDVEGWYPAQKVLNVLSDISEQPGAMWDLVAIGISAGEMGYANLPAPIKAMSFAEFLKTYATVMTSRHRNGENLSDLLHVAHAEEGSAKLVMNVPYPDDIFYGLFYAYGRKFLPKGRAIVIKYGDEAPRKDLGGKETVLHMTW